MLHVPSWKREPPSYRPAYASRLGEVSWAPASPAINTIAMSRNRNIGPQGSSYFCAREYHSPASRTNRGPSGRETNPARKIGSVERGSFGAEAPAWVRSCINSCARGTSHSRSFETITNTSRPLSSGRGMSLSCALVYGDDQRGADGAMPSGAPAERTRARAVRPGGVLGRQG
jgi:hypothetical protein